MIALIAALVLQVPANPQAPQKPDAKPEEVKRILQKGDVAVLDYTLKLRSGGKEIESTFGKTPVRVVVGRGDLLKGMDAALEGMAAGQSKDAELKPEDGFGDVALDGIPSISALSVTMKVYRIEAKGEEPKLETTDSAPGTGDAIADGAKVSVLYTGSFLNGTSFDSNRNGGAPLQFQVGKGQLIKGFDQGVLGMKLGGKRKIVVPASLGYGEKGAGGVIPPNMPLVFDVEIVKIEK